MQDRSSCSTCFRSTPSFPIRNSTWLNSFLLINFALSVEERGDTASRWRASWSLRHRGKARLRCLTCTCTGTGLSKSSMVFSFQVSFRMLLSRDIYPPVMLQQIGVTGPIGIAVTLTNTRGMILGFDSWRHQTQQSPVLNEHLFLPEAILPELQTPSPPVVKPVIDLVWNACGMPSSLYLDADGKQRPSR